MKDGRCVRLANTECVGVSSGGTDIIAVIMPAKSCLVRPEQVLLLQEHRVFEVSYVSGTMRGTGSYSQMSNSWAHPLSSYTISTTSSIMLDCNPASCN